MSLSPTPTVDKPYVEPLVKELEAAGISVWFDKTSMEWEIACAARFDGALTTCRYVHRRVFQSLFEIRKKWTEHELNALFAKEEPGKRSFFPFGRYLARGF